MSQQLFGRFTNSDGDSYITSPVGQTQNGVYVITTPRLVPSFSLGWAAMPLLSEPGSMWCQLRL